MFERRSDAEHTAHDRLREVRSCSEWVVWDAVDGRPYPAFDLECVAIGVAAVETSAHVVRSTFVDS